MSDTLAAAIVAKVLADAIKGDEEAWRFLTLPSPLLELWCGHLGVDTRLFCENMETLRQHGHHADMLRALKALHAGRGHRIAAEKRGRAA